MWASVVGKHTEICQLPCRESVSTSCESARHCCALPCLVMLQSASTLSTVEAPRSCSTKFFSSKDVEWAVDDQTRDSPFPYESCFGFLPSWPLSHADPMFFFFFLDADGLSTAPQTFQLIPCLPRWNDPRCGVTRDLGTLVSIMSVH